MFNRLERQLPDTKFDLLERDVAPDHEMCGEQACHRLADLLLDTARALVERVDREGELQLFISTKIGDSTQLEARIEVRLAKREASAPVPRLMVMVDIARGEVVTGGHCMTMAPRDIAVLAWILHARQTGDVCTVRERLQSEAADRHRARADLKVIEMGTDRCTRRAYRRVAFFRLAAGLGGLNEGFPLCGFAGLNAELERLAGQMLTKDLGQALARVRRQLEEAFGKSVASNIISFGRESFASPLPAGDISIIIPADLADHPELPVGMICAPAKMEVPLLLPQP